MQGKLLRQFREKLRAGTLSEPPNLEILRSLKLLDRTALDHWLWAVEDRELCALSGVCAGEVPSLPETLLLPHRLEPVIERLRMELDDGPPNWAHQAPLHYALALAMENPAELRRLLATVEVKARAGVGDLTHLLMSPTARSRRVSGPLARLICSRMPAGKGLRNACRVFLTRPFALRSGMALAYALTPVMSAEVVEQIRRPSKNGGDLVRRITEWLSKDGQTLRRALIQLFKHAKADSMAATSAFGTLVQYVGEEDALDDLIAVAVLARGFVEAVEGPLYAERSWPPPFGFNGRAQTASGDQVALLWSGASGEATVCFTADGAWACRFARNGRPSGSAPVRSLALPELITAGLEQAGVRTVAALEAKSDQELYPIAGVGRTGVTAIREALRSDTCTLPREENVTVEGLRRYAAAHLTEVEQERPLSEIAELPRAIARDLDQARFGSLGEVLRWSTCELGQGAVLSPGRQQRLLLAIRSHLGA